MIMGSGWCLLMFNLSPKYSLNLTQFAHPPVVNNTSIQRKSLVMKLIIQFQISVSIKILLTTLTMNKLPQHNFNINGYGLSQSQRIHHIFHHHLVLMKTLLMFNMLLKLKKKPMVHGSQYRMKTDFGFFQDLLITIHIPTLFSLILMSTVI